MNNQFYRGMLNQGEWVIPQREIKNNKWQTTENANMQYVPGGIWCTLFKLFPRLQVPRIAVIQYNAMEFHQARDSYVNSCYVLIQIKEYLLVIISNAIV